MLFKKPNDPLLDQQWGVINKTTGMDVGLKRAWDLQTGSKNVVVAVIDSGIDTSHPDLIDNLWINQIEADGVPQVDDDLNGFVDDIRGVNFVDTLNPTPFPWDDAGHGTQCAGIIGARGNNQLGLTGVNWQVTLLPIKILDHNGEGSVASAVMGIEDALMMRADILNLSWGMNSYSQLFYVMIQKTAREEAFVAAATGNDSANSDHENPSFSAAFDLPNLLSVASVGTKGELSTYSNYGHKQVHIAAPGEAILTTKPRGEYETASGTSMAAPFVAGIAALLKAQDPKMTSVEIRNRILRSSRMLRSLHGRVKSGGLVNAFHALSDTRAPLESDDPSDWLKKEISIETPHPYRAKYKQSQTVTIKRAKQLVLEFSKVEAEKDVDVVSLLDRTGKMFEAISGSFEEIYSAVIPGDKVQIQFQADGDI